MERQEMEVNDRGMLGGIVMGDVIGFMRCMETIVRKKNKNTHRIS